jgi:acyl-CoA thioester hydrolase
MLIEHGLLEIERSPIIGLCVESGCRYYAPLAFPETIEAGLRIGRLGNSSVRYEVGLFRRGEPKAAAEGHFVHVFVDRQTRRPAPIGEAARRTFEAMIAPRSAR